jgi:endonuclease YncB( thermonuclease family)
MNIFLLTFILAATPNDYRFSRLVDGDTFIVLDSKNHQHAIRLWGVDAPEYSQPLGGNARAALGEPLVGKIITVEVTGHRREREIAKVMADGVDVNEAMVKQGLAWWDKQAAPKDKALESAEKEARKEKVGLWKEGQPTPPWEWRRKEKVRRVKIP